MLSFHKMDCIKMWNRLVMMLTRLDFGQWNNISNVSRHWLYPPVISWYIQCTEVAEYSIELNYRGYIPSSSVGNWCMSRSTCNCVKFASCESIFMKNKEVVEDAQVRLRNLSKMETDKWRRRYSCLKQSILTKTYGSLRVILYVPNPKILLKNMFLCLYGFQHFLESSG